MRVLLIATLLLFAGTAILPTAEATCRPDVDVRTDWDGNVYVIPTCDGIVSGVIRYVSDPR